MKASAILLIPALLFVPIGQCAHGATKTAPPAKTPADPGWPRETTKNGVKLTVYQPQVDEWKDYRQLKVRAAIVLTPKAGNPMIGVAEFGGMTTTNAQERTVLIRDLKITEARFPSLPEAEVAPMEKLLQDTFPAHSLTVSLDRLAASVERAAETKPLDLKMEPPAIFVSTTPAVLLHVDGKPVLAPVPDTGLEFVVNTNWDLFFDKQASAYYLLADKSWLTAPTPDGEWALASKLPAAIGKLPKGDQWDYVRQATPLRIERGMAVPRVFYSEKPAELVDFKGDPTWAEVEGTRLQWAQNAEGWVFQDTADKQIYLLLSGRWFRAAKMEGPWTYAGNDLPEDFKQILPDGPCADVLASVPGTPEAADAIVLAEVPNEAVVNCKEAEAKAKVSYDGERKFSPIEGTEMTYATNSAADVIAYQNKYYLCQDAVWFVGAAAVGPWVVCADVPAAIYTIPPAYPVHRVTYVKVEKSDNTSAVVCSYTAGYFGAFVAGVGLTAALVWGTGWDYPSYTWYGGAVPVYRPWPATYGVAAAYNPWTGGYAVGARAYGPYATAGRAAWYNPDTGRYGRAAGVVGPYGARGAAVGYNPHTGTGWATRQGSNGFAQWGTSAVRRGDDWVRAGHVSTANGGAAAWRGSEGGGRVWRNGGQTGGAAVHNGDFYAGHDGNVYRRDNNGDWAKYDHGDWNSVDHKDDLKNARNRYQQSSQRINNNGNRLGANGAGVQRTATATRTETTRVGKEGVERRTQSRVTTARRAEVQPSADTVKRLNKESLSRSRSDFHAQRTQTVQRAGGGAFSGSRSFSARTTTTRSFGGARRAGGGGGFRRR